MKNWNKESLQKRQLIWVLIAFLIFSFNSEFIFSESRKGRVRARRKKETKERGEHRRQKEPYGIRSRGSLGREKAKQDLVTKERQSRLKSGKYERSVDILGRTIVYEGWLALKEGSSARGPKIEGKDRAHLIASMFGGSGAPEHTVPADPRKNRSYQLTLENALARRVRAGVEIYLRVRVNYDATGKASLIYYDIYKRTSKNNVEWKATVSLNPLKPVGCTLREAVKGKTHEWYDF